MQKFHRGTRRHHRERLMKNRKNYYGGVSNCFFGKRTKEEEIRLLNIWARTAQVCSCYMCGNPRKHWNQVTIQEIKFKAFACVEEI